MSTRKWTTLTLLFTLAVGGSFVALCAWLDIYGLFRDTHGRSLPIYDSERRGKYLLNLHYVPENFEAVLIGSSVTGNWNTSGIELYRTYNESTDGGNITEEKILVERALLSPGIKMAICVLHPFLTDTHGLNTEEMTDREYWGALGSTTLLRSWKRLATTSMGREKLVWDAYGAEDVESPVEINPTLRRVMMPDGDYHVDEVAFEEYRSVVDALHRRGVKVAAVVPPTVEDLLEPRREAMDRYVRRMWTLFSPDDVLIDLNAPDVAAFRRDKSHYRDGVHLSRAGAVEVVKLLNARLLAVKAQLGR